MKSTSRLRRLWTLTAQAARNWSNDNAATTGAALAFYCTFSLAPLLVILITIAGGVIGREQAYDGIQKWIQWFFGPQSASTVMNAVLAARQSLGTTTTVISAVTLLITASSIFTALHDALNRIWRCTDGISRGIRGFIHTYVLSFGCILALGFLLLVFLTLSTALAGLRSDVLHQYAGVVRLLKLVNFGVSLAVTGGLLALIYRYMPERRTPWRIVITGGMLTALLFQAGRGAISLYLLHSASPSAFGAAASFAVLLLWLYYTAQIFLYGAEFTACMAGARGNPNRP